MGKTDWKDEAKSLKKKLSKLKARVKAEKPEAKTAGAKPVSPLAPASFPTLPAIGGVEFSAVEAECATRTARM